MVKDSGRCWYLDRASSVYAMNARQTPTARARPQKAGSNQGYGTEDNDHYGYISVGQGATATNAVIAVRTTPVTLHIS
jgi:hypothetical protein